MCFEVEIQPAGRRFQAAAGETLLDAALRQGVGLPWGCRSGNCGSCIASRVSGRVEYPDGEPQAGQQADEVVLCQAHARSDLVLQVRELSDTADIAIKTLPARAEHLERLSHDVMQVLLKLPESERMPFLAGQYIEFILKDGRRRAFSIANAPHQDEFIELHIRHVPGGEFTGHVFEEMKDKALVRIEGPLGSFYLREHSDRPILMMAGGTGVAPLKGIIEHARHIGMARPMHLFWGVESRQDLYLKDLPQRWVDEGGGRFRYTPVLERPKPEDDWQGETGLVQDALLRAYPELSPFDIYLSGPPAMIDAAMPVFARHGASLAHMYSDAFEFARDVLERIAREKHETGARG
ncbi:MAG TPA: CDP-6-deoxy-delta-3,4-glucoseen reductase [Gammaproteobacteria bacterium]|nr:CDP-6-deoxy-delta-3,4-glucoseen reductase [Gammaproteobacteria bacterium]